MSKKKRRSLKRSILLVGTIVGLQLLNCAAKSFAEDSNLPSISTRVKQLEMVVLGSVSPDKSSEQRMSAVELKVFGVVQQGSLPDRLIKVQQTVADQNAKNSHTDAWPGFSMTVPANADPVGASSSAQTPLAQPALAPSPDKAAVVSPQSPSPQESGPAATGASQTPTGNSIPAADPKSVRALPEQQPKASIDDGWPTALPTFDSPNIDSKIIKVEVSENAENIEVNLAKKQPEQEVYKKATDALENDHWPLAEKLFAVLCERKPKDPRYFYGQGLAYQNQGDLENAFSNLVIAWHLGNAPVYTQAASALIPALQKALDGTFKLTYQWSPEDPEAVLNAGTRLWKAGVTGQAVKLFEYALKNEPVCRGVAAYDLGAVAEHNGNLKLARQYYAWAANENARLQALADRSPALSASINKSLNTLPKGYVEQALAQVEQKLLRGDAAWNGWPQAVSYPTWWASEVCPLCGISRTSATYSPGQEQLK